MMGSIRVSNDDRYVSYQSLCTTLHDMKIYSANEGKDVFSSGNRGDGLGDCGFKDILNLQLIHIV